MDVLDHPRRYGSISRALHWGMAALFAAQFASAAARALLPRGNDLRDALWSYHTDLGVTLFVLVMLRGAWGLANRRTRPGHGQDILGRAAAMGHAALYLLMILVPGVRLLASAGSERGLSYFGWQIFPAREAKIAWMQVAADWHGELGWLLAFVVVGHIVMAVGWHHVVLKDGTLARMAGRA